MPETPTGETNRYKVLIENIFFAHWKKGATKFRICPRRNPAVAQLEWHHTSRTIAGCLFDAGYGPDRRRLDLSPGSGVIVATIPTPRTNPSNTLTLTIDPFASSTCVLFGMYGFFFTGFDSSGPVTIGGVLESTQTVMSAAKKIQRPGRDSRRSAHHGRLVHR